MVGSQHDNPSIVGVRNIPPYIAAIPNGIHLIEIETPWRYVGAVRTMSRY